MDQIGELNRLVESTVVVLANHYQFSPGQDFSVCVIGSRMMLWGISGSGRVVTAQGTFDLEPGMVLLLPWRHDIRYLADRRDPFLTGAVHLVPWHAPGETIEPRAGHGELDPLNASPFRRNVEWPGFSRQRTYSGPAAQRLIRLGESAVDQFTERDPDEASMRAFGLLIGRTIAALRAESGSDDSSPTSLIAMQEYVRSHLGTPLTTEVLARVGSCSVSTAERQFRRYAGRSPGGWIRHERLANAARMLRTSNKRIGEIAEEVGFDDRLYFSRAFKVQYGVPPSRYGQRAPLL
ncbi:helix-turn-helix transcriptional regulator [Glaciibacter superstes]|uniref:helix-turn-helix transcriptional regulator n=1 Tax=Glaciibacter superstes TaxID=501023 RepID=UPI0003B5FFD9|nr:AraC family transcriptional regulator [Glaciibacter superstes]